MSFADGFHVRSAHKAERFAVLEVDVRRMGERVKFWGDLFQFVELGEKLFFGQFANTVMVVLKRTAFVSSRALAAF